MKTLIWITMFCAALAISASATSKGKKKSTRKSKVTWVKPSDPQPLGTKFVSRPNARFVLPTLSIEQFARLPKEKALRYLHITARATAKLSVLQPKFGVKTVAQKRKTSDELYAILLGDYAVAGPQVDGHPNCVCAAKFTIYTSAHGTGHAGKCHCEPCEPPNNARLVCGIFAGGLSDDKRSRCIVRAAEADYTKQCFDQRRALDAEQGARLGKRVNCDNLFSDTNSLGPTGLLHCYQKRLKEKPTFSQRMKDKELQSKYAKALKDCSYNYECLVHISKMKVDYESTGPKPPGFSAWKKLVSSDKTFGQFARQADKLDEAYTIVRNICSQPLSEGGKNNILRRAKGIQKHVLNDSELANLASLPISDRPKYYRKHVLHSTRGSWFQRREYYRSLLIKANAKTRAPNTYRNVVQKIECEELDRTLTTVQGEYNALNAEYYQPQPILIPPQTKCPRTGNADGMDLDCGKQRPPVKPVVTIPPTKPRPLSKDYACDQPQGPNPVGGQHFNVGHVVDTNVACLVCSSLNDVAKSRKANIYQEHRISEKWLSFVSIIARQCGTNLPAGLIKGNNITLEGAVWLRNAYGFCDAGTMDWTASDRKHSSRQKIREWKTRGNERSMNRKCKKNEDCVNFKTVFGVSLKDAKRSMCPKQVRNAKGDKKFVVTRKSMRALRDGQNTWFDDSNAKALRACAKEAAEVADEVYSKRHNANSCPTVSPYSKNLIRKHALSNETSAQVIGTAINDCLTSRSVKGAQAEFIGYGVDRDRRLANTYIDINTGALSPSGPQLSKATDHSFANCPDVAPKKRKRQQYNYSDDDDSDSILDDLSQ